MYLRIINNNIFIVLLILVKIIILWTKIIKPIFTNNYHKIISIRFIQLKKK